MNTGIIYLVQPAELIGTERYKFGCSENTELDRVKKGYKKGTRYLNIMECKNPYDLEKKIKNIFNEKFKKIAGNEYFEGNETDMSNEFIKVVNEHRKNMSTNDKMDDREIYDEQFNQYVISTYKEFIKYNEISNIIITNKTTQEGYFRFNNEFYRILPPNSLLELIEKNLKYFYLKNIGCVEYNTKKIIDDIIKECYLPKVIESVDNLKYHEYAVCITYEDNKTCDYLFNSLNCTFTSAKDINDELNKRILLYNPIVFCNKKNINMNIINNILLSLVEKDTINLFKKLVYNVLVEQIEEKIIFNDFNERLLSGWFEDILYSISTDTKSIRSYDYYENTQKIKNLIKKYKIQCVFIYENDKRTIKKQIKDFDNLGFKYIIVKQMNKNKRMYNMNEYRNFINLNKENILKIINSEQNDKNYDWDSIIQYDDNIFSRRNLLHTNFLKWCCTK
jgi:hypothetical protein